MWDGRIRVEKRAFRVSENVLNHTVKFPLSLYGALSHDRHGGSYVMSFSTSEIFLQDKTESLQIHQRSGEV